MTLKVPLARQRQEPGVAVGVVPLEPVQADVHLLVADDQHLLLLAEQRVGDARHAHVDVAVRRRVDVEHWVLVVGSDRRGRAATVGCASTSSPRLAREQYVVHSCAQTGRNRRGSKRWRES